MPQYDELLQVQLPEDLDADREFKPVPVGKRVMIETFPSGHRMAFNLKIIERKFKTEEELDKYEAYCAKIGVAPVMVWGSLECAGRVVGAEPSLAREDGPWSVVTWRPKLNVYDAEAGIGRDHEPNPYQLIKLVNCLLASDLPKKSGERWSKSAQLLAAAYDRYGITEQTHPTLPLRIAAALALIVGEQPRRLVVLTDQEKYPMRNGEEGTRSVATRIEDASEETIKQHGIVVW